MCAEFHIKKDIPHQMRLDVWGVSTATWPSTDSTWRFDCSHLEQVCEAVWVVWNRFGPNPAK